MTIPSREAILSANSIKNEKVKVPELGPDVEMIVSTMTGTMRDAWEMSLIGDGKTYNMANASARLLTYCIVNEKGDRVFKDGDADELGKLSSKIIFRLTRVA